jgi:hypothetical protein
VIGCTDPPIGQPRTYEPGEQPRLYPGEMMTSTVDPGWLRATLLQRTGRPVVIPEAVLCWTVMPAPGWRNGLRRWRYRLLDQYRSSACLVTVHLDDGPPA